MTNVRSSLNMEVMNLLPAWVQSSFLGSLTKRIDGRCWNNSVLESTFLHFNITSDQERFSRFRAIGVSDCPRRIGIGTRHGFSLASVSSSRSRFPVVPVSADPRMSCGVLPSWFRAVQRDSNHNIRPRSDRKDHLCRNSHLALEEVTSIIDYASLPWHFGQK